MPSREGVILEPGEEHSFCRARQTARGLTEPSQPVPDVVVTNYSMLEYMLCRPQDQVFFGPRLRCVVLDEAHLYAGTLAAEITLLLRRLYDRCGLRPEEVMQIATSATLGGTDNQLWQFAATIFTRDIGDVALIRGEKTRPALGEIIPPGTRADAGGPRHATAHRQNAGARPRDWQAAVGYCPSRMCGTAIAAGRASPPCRRPRRIAPRLAAGAHSAHVAADPPDAGNPRGPRAVAAGGICA